MQNFVRRASSSRSLLAAPSLLAAMVAFAALVPAFAGRPPVAAAGAVRADAKYIGAKMCKSCHSSAETGNQYGAWEEMLHAKAFETLGSEKAKAIATERGLGDPQQADECLRCHVTGHGEPADMVKKSLDPKMGVQCESCHGPGETHLRGRMAAAAKKSADAPAWVELPEGEMTSSPGIDTCLRCHNDDSPTFTDFCYCEKIQKVRHLNPAKPRTEAQLAAMRACPCPDDCKCKGEGGCCSGGECSAAK